MRSFKVVLRTQKPDFFYFTMTSALTRKRAISKAKRQAFFKGYTKTKPYLVQEV